MKYFSFILCFIGMFHTVYAKEKELAEKGFGLFEVDFPAYLSQHDTVYQDPDYDGFNRFLLGNSDLGGMAYVCILSPKPIAKKAAPQ